MEKRGLGKGLAALIPESENEASRSEIREIAVAQISVNPYQPRTLFDPIKMEELVASIREHGILQPILLRRLSHENYQLVAGERRFRAAQKAGLSAIPALIKEMTEREQLEIAVVENVQREDIGPMEAARAYRRLIDDFRMTQESIAQRIGKTRSSIANTLRLLALPEDIQASVEQSQITEGHARAILTADTLPAMLYVWQQVIKKQLSVRDAERLAKTARASVLGEADNPRREPDTRSVSQPVSSTAKQAIALDPNEAAVAERLQQALGTKVTLRRTSGEMGRIEIEFYTNEDLERITELLIMGRSEE